jgi:hypothetical protein
MALTARFKRETTSAAEHVNDPNKAQFAAGSIADMREEIELNRPLLSMRTSSARLRLSSYASNA